MFLLPDSRTITEDLVDEIYDAMLCDKPCDYFLDLKELEVIYMPHAHKRKLKCFLDDLCQFVLIPRIDQKEVKSWMVQFLDDIIYDDEETKLFLKKILDKKNKSVLAIEKEFEKFDEACYWGWIGYRDDVAWEEIKSWITSAPINAKDDPDYWFSDGCCAVCRYMNVVEKGLMTGTEKGLLDAFDQESNKKDEDIF